MRNPFTVEPDIVPGSDEDEFLEIEFDSSMKDFFQEHFIQELWSEANISSSYNEPFAISCLGAFATGTRGRCEGGGTQ